MVKLPSRSELMSYAEDCPIDRKDARLQIIQLMGQSPQFREKMAELKKDLYLIEAHIPDFEPTTDLAKDLGELARAWMAMKWRRNLGPGKFIQTKEFAGLATLLLLAGAVLFLVILRFGL